jgi:hypothetical protein
MARSTALRTRWSTASWISASMATVPEKLAEKMVGSISMR